MKRLHIHNCRKTSINGFLQYVWGITLTAISDACFEENLPLLSSLVISEDIALPGDGYFRQMKVLYGTEDDQIVLWRTECDEVFRQKNWLSLIQRLKSDG